MGQGDRKIADPAEIEEILQNARACRVTLAGGSGPHIVPVCFGFETGAPFLHATPDPRAIACITNNPRCWFAVDLFDGPCRDERACSWGSHHRRVTGSGTAAVLTDPDEKRHAIACIMRRYDSGSRGFSEEEIRKIPVIRIAIGEMAGEMKG